MADFLLLTTDFKPMLGGVADYTYHLARQLHRHGRLAGVLTTAEGAAELPLPVGQSGLTDQRRLGERPGDGFVLTRKLNTLRHYRTLQRQALSDLTPFRGRENLCVLVGSYYGYVPHRWVMACQKLGLRYGILFHGLDILWNLKQFPAAFRRLSADASFLMFNSRATQALFEREVTTARVPRYVLHPGLDLKAIDQMPPPATLTFGRAQTVPKGAFVVSCVARLVRRKGVDLAIAAVGRLRAEFPDLLLLVAGKGPEAEALAAQVRAARLEQHVWLLGPVSDAEKFALLRRSEVFLMPSRSLGGDDFEGFGISFLEASYCGNVTIGGSHGGVPEAIRHGETGYTLDFDQPDAVDSLVELLREIVSNASARQQMQQRGTDHARRFNWPALVDDLLETTHW